MLSVGDAPTHRLTDERADLRTDTVNFRNIFAVKKSSLRFIIVINEDSKVSRIVRCKEIFSVFFVLSPYTHRKRNIC